MSDHDTSDEMSPKDELPRRWVDEYFANEESVQRLLDETRELHLLGEHDQVRERLRAFAAAERGLFQVVAYTVLDVDRFYADVEAQYDSPPLEELRALGRTYDPLSSEFEVILTEQLHDLHNPKPRIRRVFRYSEAQELPRLEYDVLSGEVQLCELAHTPSQALILAGLIVDNVGQLLDRVVENDDDLATAEHERLAQIVSELTTDLEHLTAVVDRFEGETMAPAGDDGDGEVYEDWSFY
jgi:hypothetical protein